MICNIDEYLNLVNSEDKEDTNRTINEELSSELILEIIKNYPGKKSWLAHNKHLPVSVLRLLALDENDDVRFTIAMKKKCDRHIFEILMKDPNFSVRMAVVRNNKLPIDLLKLLAFDKENEISEEAKRIITEKYRGY